ncbi:hypothetical protein Z957_09580 [Clostridium sp. K25]|uniref:DEAD/DEAH box helicase family protein n=1 Tax=Clostridium sp. K25 TaxID=1443109 RepID=UPI0004D97356|nr:DEAD/DEAH box helicase family protein [Clostridium sp. K25]KEI07166.1 hypothetical protein Z957_09580 [Clostridium sp. K25]
MSLKDLKLKFKYRSNKDLLYKDFYDKCIRETKYYYRASGYFTSSSLKTIARGLEKFIQSDGKIRIIANPYLNENDIKSINLGYMAKKDVIIQSLFREIEVTIKTIENETLNILAWLVYKDILEFKIAFTKSKNDIYHEKFGVFIDEEGNKVAFSGSANETVGGIKNNFEKIDVFFNEGDKERIDDMINDFNNLWENKTNGLEVINMPEAIKSKILKYKKDKIPSIKKHRKIEPREYQIKAIRAFKDNKWKGILEMATGTGKTITSLLIAKDYFNYNGRIFLIILVPFVHLIDQWEKNCRDMELVNSLNCTGLKSKWKDKLNNKVRDFNIGISKIELIITTYRSACSEEFNYSISNIKGKAFIIADECHYFGIRGLRNHRFHNIECKLGLSATPDRWWDDEGTKILRSFFGDTVYKYDIKEAIEKEVLTEYKYIPIIVDLDQDEIKKYESLTKNLIYLLETKKDKDDIERINSKRSLILLKANMKKQLLYEILAKEDMNNIAHTLIYCAPGEVESITKNISNMGIRVHRFDSKISADDRKSVLKAFAKGDIQVLVAIKCLDEGVDVPSTKVAYFLASTSNPREFIQRRGRILRKYKGKNIAELYDFIVLPSKASDKTFRTIASKELPRFAEFSRYAINNFKCREEIKNILFKYNLEHLMDKLPWEVYNEIKEKWEE